jgi:hypothetical protein
MRTPLSTELGIEFPLFAFSHCRDVVAGIGNGRQMAAAMALGAQGQWPRRTGGSPEAAGPS